MEKLLRQFNEFLLGSDVEARKLGWTMLDASLDISTLSLDDLALLLLLIQDSRYRVKDTQSYSYLPNYIHLAEQTKLHKRLQSKLQFFNNELKHSAFGKAKKIAKRYYKDERISV